MSLKAKLEAVIYAAEEPVTLAQLAAIFSDEVPQESTEEPAAEPAPEAEPIALEETPAEGEPVPENAAGAETPSEGEPAENDQKKAARQRDRQVRQALQVVLDELISDYAGSDRGMEVREIAGGYRMATKPEYHDAVRGFVKSLKPPMKLSLQALETLAVIAYKQPVTAPEVSEIRGVDSGGVLGSLVSRKLITTAGRKQVIGRPILYKTTKEFLLRFGLKDVNDLPSMEEFEKMAGELVEPETPGEAQEAAESATELVHEPTDEAQEVAEAATEPVHEPTDEAQEIAEPSTEPAQEPTSETQEVAEAATELVHEPTDEAQEAAESATELVHEPTDEAQEKAEVATELVHEPTGEAQEEAEAATELVHEPTGEAQEVAEAATEPVPEPVAANEAEEPPTSKA